MLEIGILKNFDSGTYKAGVQLAGSLTTYFDDISVAKNIPSSALVIGNYVILAIPGGNPKDACVIATWPQGSAGGGAFLDLSDTPSSYSGQAGKYVKVNSAANALEFGLACSKFTPKVTDTPLWRRNAVCDSSFEALINGTPTATSVVYDNDVRENSLPDTINYPQWGKVILHNITRGNSRKITGVNTSTNTITTESSSDDWADGDIITTGSQTCVYTGGGRTYSWFFDIDISAEVPSTATTMIIYFSTRNYSGTGSAAQDQLISHPFESFAAAKASGQMCTAAYQSEVVYAVLPIVNQKICLAFGIWGPVTASGMLVIVQIRGYWE